MNSFSLWQTCQFLKLRRRVRGCYESLFNFLQRMEMDAEKEKYPKTRNEVGKKSEGGMFSAPNRRPSQVMLSLPKGVEAENVKTRIHHQEELGEKNQKRAEELASRDQNTEVWTGRVGQRSGHTFHNGTEHGDAASQACLR